MNVDPRGSDLNCWHQQLLNPATSQQQDPTLMSECPHNEPALRGDKSKPSEAGSMESTKVGTTKQPTVIVKGTNKHCQVPAASGPFAAHSKQTHYSAAAIGFEDHEPSVNQLSDLVQKNNDSLSNRSVQLSLRECVDTTSSSHPDSIALGHDESNSFLFLRFLSNLPKSIVQRSKSNSTLAPEVADYLAANKRQCNQLMMTTYNETSSLGQRPPAKETALEGPSSTAQIVAKPMQNNLRHIKIVAPPEMSLQEPKQVSSTRERQASDLEACKPAPKTGTIKSLSIANSNTTTTTNTTIRSSASSLSSCILSESSASEVRLKWGKKMDFLLSIIGFAVDLANIWRFPYLVYKNGGGVFLIPYVTMLIFGGIPLLFLELCLGQFVKKGPITVWNKICPSMKGVGYCCILISWYVSFYYNVLIAWSVYFIYRSLISMGGKMPWEDCENSWNSKDTCVSIKRLNDICSPSNETLESCRKRMFGDVNVTSPTSEFFVRELSQIDQSTGLDDMGYLRPELVLCLMVVYLLHYFSLFKGLETSGKVVWVTATAPYMILSVLLVRGVFLPGASTGIKYYLSPKLEKLADPSVWIDAASQVFYSIGVGFGVHLTYASFNGHNNNCHRDCLVTSAVNVATSVYSGLVVFIYLGYMAQSLGVEIDKVASEGYSLAFEIYPEALTTLPWARFWSILFFIMLLTLGIDSAMGGLEAVITGLEDEFKFAKRLSRKQLTGLVVVSSFMPALVSCTQGGAYTLFWLDIYSAGVSLLFSALFETIGVVYCYGLKKFIPNIESMIGHRPHIFYIICWKYISPLFLVGVIFMAFWTASRPTYRGYTFPVWSIVLGWILALSSAAAIPIVAICRFFKKDKNASSLTPEKRLKKNERQPTNKKFLAVSCHDQITTTLAEAAVMKALRGDSMIL